MDHLLLAILASLWMPTPLCPRALRRCDDRLAAAKGCYTCHRADPGTADPKAMLPYAPSWKEIALKYKGQKSAERRLTKVILEGSWQDRGQRHWAGKVSMVGMLPNAVSIDKDQAKQIVHSTLGFDR